MTGSTVKRDLQVSPSVKSTDTPDGVVLLDIHGGMCFPLDQVGTFIWKRLKQQLETGIIAQQIASAYQIPIQQATTDLHEFLQQLQASRLLLGANRQEHSKRLPWTAAFGTPLSVAYRAAEYLSRRLNARQILVCSIRRISALLARGRF